MDLVATLVSNPKTQSVDSGLVAHARTALPRDQVVQILNEGVAFDILFAGEAGRSEAAYEAALREAVGDAPVDILVQPVAFRRKRLLVADMDSTLIGQECVDELADVLGLKPEVAAITEQAMRGEIDFAPALRKRVGLLAGLDVAVIQDLLEMRIHLTPGARVLVQTMRAHGAYTALVSGGFTAFTGPIAEKLGMHEHRSNILDVVDGKLAGTVQEPILGKDAKRQRFLELMAERGLKREETLAVGDGANDLPMIEAAGLGVAFHAKPVVAAAARARITYGDLTALLHFQGYTDDDFVGA